MPTTSPRISIPTSDELFRLRQLVMPRGSRATARAFGLSSHALDRVVAGLPVHSGTSLIIKARLAAAEAELAP